MGSVSRILLKLVSVGMDRKQMAGTIEKHIKTSNRLQTDCHFNIRMDSTGP